MPKERRRQAPYRTAHPYDPVRRLLAAVALQAVFDADPTSRAPQYYQESAKLFLSDEEGQAFLHCFGISIHKVRDFVERSSVVLEG